MGSYQLLRLTRDAARCGTCNNWNPASRLVGASRLCPPPRDSAVFSFVDESPAAIVLRHGSRHEGTALFQQHEKSPPARRQQLPVPVVLRLMEAPGRSQVCCLVSG